MDISKISKKNSTKLSINTDFNTENPIPPV